MTIENKLVPKGAMQLLDKGCHAAAFSETGTDGKEATKMEMVVYSGGVIKNHWYWDDLVIDLEGAKFSKKKYPVLEDHSTERKIAFSGKPVVKDGQLRLEPESTIFVDTEISREFQKLSKQGFPFQSSLRGVPRRVERIEEGTETQVNGFTLKGPGTVWREWEYMEGSVCVFGWDDKTSAAAFSKEEVALDYELTLSKKEEPPTPSKEEPKIMNIEQFKKDHPDLYAEIVKSATDQAVASFSQEKTALTSTIETLTTNLSKSDEQVKKLSQRDAIRTEKEIFSESEVVWTKKLVASDIPERMFEKVKKNVDYNAFVKDDVLDTVAFSAAIDAELKDWAEFSLKSDPTVLGQGFSLKDVEKNTAVQAENEKLVDSLFSLAGYAAK